jgi:hydroxypyruvate isomerase
VHDFALNVSMVFTDRPLLDRFDAAAAAGFDLVELWWPYAELRDGLEESVLVRRVRDAGLRVALLNLPAGDFSIGERGLVGMPGREEELRAAVPPACELAARLGCARLNALAGRRSPGHTAADQLAVLASGLAWVADTAGPDVTITVEALNATDLPGYLLPDTTSALDLVDRLGRVNVGIQLDVYHAAMAGEDVPAVIRAATGRIAHVQLADVPGRHEPGTGSLDFPAILATLGAAGYRGAIGLEYTPTVPQSPDFAFLGALSAAWR